MASKIWIDNWQTEHHRHTEFQEIIIEGIDTDEVIRRYSGSVQEFMELLDLYWLDGKRKTSVLRELWMKGDYKTYGIEVHALKSASANIGAMRVSNSAREQEKAVDRGDESFVDSHISQLLADYEKQLEQIGKFLKKNQKAPKAAKKETQIEKQDLLGQIEEALDNLENFRSKECAAKIGEILQHHLSEEIEAKLEEVSEQLKLYEDDAAEQMLRDLIGYIRQPGETAEAKQKKEEDESKDE